MSGSAPRVMNSIGYRQKPRLGADGALIDTLKSNKAGIIRNLAVQQVAKPGADPTTYILSHDEFTERYLMLMQAHRTGRIDDQTKSDGLEFLLDHWDGASDASAPRKLRKWRLDPSSVLIRHAPW
jgi:hypothetical protein